MAIRPEAVRDLQDKCGLSPALCRKALAAHAGDVDAALAALIDAGKMTAGQLDPETVSDALFERAARRDQVRIYEQMLSGQLLQQMARQIGGKRSSRMGKVATAITGTIEQAMAQQLGGKTAEQLVDEAEQQRRARLEQMQNLLPDMGAAPFITMGQQARAMQRIQRRQAALTKRPVTLRLPPFPPLKMTLSEWHGTDVLPAWAGTQERLGGYTSQSSARPSKGKVRLEIPRLDDNDLKPRPPAPEHVKAYAHFRENGERITEAVLKALLRYYKDLRKGWLKHQDWLDLPEISDVHELRRHVGVGIVRLLSIAKTGHAYIGMELGCTWDEEHGAGVIVHKSRVVEVGSADTSFNEHLALKDGGKRIEIASRR